MFLVFAIHSGEAGEIALKRAYSNPIVAHGPSTFPCNNDLYIFPALLDQ